MRIELNLPAFQYNLVIEKRNEKQNMKSAYVVFDPVRKKKIVLTTEEIIRQLMLQYLMIEKKYPSARIRVEKGLKVNTRLKRCDILIYNRQAQPYILVECKSPEVEIDDTVFEQIARYNLTLQVPYLVVTNGITTYCCKMNLSEKSWIFLNDIPIFDAEI